VLCTDQATGELAEPLNMENIVGNPFLTEVRATISQIEINIAAQAATQPVGKIYQPLHSEGILKTKCCPH
jgi:hypothetical protein